MGTNIPVGKTKPRKRGRYKKWQLLLQLIQFERKTSQEMSQRTASATSDSQVELKHALKRARALKGTQLNRLGKANCKSDTRSKGVAKKE